MILLGNGDGTFQTPVSYEAACCSSEGMGIADFSGDGKLDLAVVSGSSIQVFLGKPDGTFQSPLTFAGCGEGLAVGGFDESGRLGVAIANDCGANSVSILLQVPAVSLSATSLTFADQVTGTTSASQKVTLTNTSGLTLIISSIAVTGTDAGDFSETNTCGTGLAVGGRCTISLTFKPTENRAADGLGHHYRQCGG